MGSSLRSQAILWIATIWLFACGSETAAGSPPAAPGARRAVLIGIDDYSASRIAPPATGGAGPARGLRNLEGTVNDVRAIRGSLVDRYGFAERDIVTLTDQQATREAILRAIEQHLVKPARKGDVLLFYFSGHGSQVANSLSEEPDRLDESIVPADSRLGARDVRDKELRPLFNRILDQGALLTVVLDSCHSGSGARIPFGDALPRGVRRDSRDIRDGSGFGPRPEDRGALVLAATQDFDLAWETQGPDGQAHGAFSLALVHAMQNPTAGESAEETFLRVRARLQAERRFQEPVLAGVAAVRRAPLLGGTTGRTAERTVVAVERVGEDGTVILQGGWANGLTPGSELRALEGESRLQIVEVTDPTRCKARAVGPAQSGSLQKGTLMEVVSWAAPPDAPLRVFLPEAEALEPAVALARELAQGAARRGVEWIEDPTERTPTHVLRWRDKGWELLDAAGNVEPFGSEARADAVLARLSAGSAALFVQVPAPAGLVETLVLGPGTLHSGVERANRPREAEYILLGRLSGEHPEYAWVRSEAMPEDRRRTGLPLRSSWQPLGEREPDGRYRKPGQALENAILRLRKIHAWQHLDSPAGGAWAYRLGLRREKTDTLAENGTVQGQEVYSLLLRAKTTPLPAAAERRHVYVFVIDSHGRSVLLYPLSGSVENRFPQRQEVPAEISLGRTASFRVSEPYGVDTYLLLTTDEPLPNPWILEWDGVRTRGPRGATPLEELLSVTGGSIRAADPILVPANWSLERTLIESIRPGPSSQAAD